MKHTKTSLLLKHDHFRIRYRKHIDLSLVSKVKSVALQRCEIPTFKFLLENSVIVYFLLGNFLGKLALIWEGVFSVSVAQNSDFGHSWGGVVFRVGWAMFGTKSMVSKNKLLKTNTSYIPSVHYISFTDQLVQRSIFIISKWPISPQILLIRVRFRHLSKNKRCVNGLQMKSQKSLSE